MLVNSKKMLEEGKTDARFKELAKITKEHNGLWSKEAEDYLLANF